MKNRPFPKKLYIFRENLGEKVPVYLGLETELQLYKYQGNVPIGIYELKETKEKS